MRRRTDDKPRENLCKSRLEKKSAKPLVVNRLGYGTMRLTGPEIWGEPVDRAQALAILREAVASEVNFLDTADCYGEDITNRLIVEALYPYRNDLVICTKVGTTRKSDKSWVPYNTPENLRAAIDKNLKALKQSQISLVHLRVMPGTKTHLAESVRAMFELQQDGKILHVGLSNVSPSDLEMGMKMGEIATVENMHGYGQRTSVSGPQGQTRGGEEVLTICEQNEIPLVPFFSLLNSLSKSDGRMNELAKQRDVSSAQMNIAWLLHKSPWILPISGTSRLVHLQENLKASAIQLSAQDMDFLEGK